MTDTIVPTRKVGYLSPLAVIDNAAYEWYRLAPRGWMALFLSIGTTEFSAKEMDRIFAPLDGYLDQLMGRHIDLTLQAGTPMAVLMGVAKHDAMMAHIERYTGKPATSTVQSVVRAARHLRLKKIALVNKWSVAMNRTLGEFYAREGIAVCGASTKEMAPADFVKIRADDHIQLAYELGLQAFRDNPDCDGIYLGGGTWLSEPVTRRLEQEAGKYVICNQTAQIWDIQNLFGEPNPIANSSRLLARA